MRGMYRFCRVVAVDVAAACLMSGLSGAPAVAQTVSPAVAAGETGSGSQSQGATALEEVIVTARRKEEDVQKIPVAVTAISQRALQENNIQTVGDLQNLVPSLTATPDSNGGYTRDSLNVSIRGQGLSGLSGLPAVVAYLNEVPLPNDINGALVGGPGGLFDLENVAVLKGPQGTLFGRNTTGGALLLTSARPTDEFGGRLQVGYGNYNDREIDGALNVPLVGSELLARVAINGQVRDGFTNIVTPIHPDGTDADSRADWALRTTLTYHPNELLKNDTILTYQNYDTHGSPAFLYAVNPTFATGYPTLSSLAAQQQALGIRDHLPQGTEPVSRGDVFVVNNISSVAVSDALTFRNIFGYVRSSTDAGFEWDGTVLPILDVLIPPSRETQNQYSEEGQLQGKSLGGKLDWILGGFYLHDTPAGYTAIRQAIFGGNDFSLDKRGSTSTGVYAHGIYALDALLSGVQLAGGLRYTWDHRSYDLVIFPANCPDGIGCTGTPGSQPSRSKALTWDVSLDYQVRPKTLLYVTSRRGYRAGGSNGISEGELLPQFGPEYVTDVELGIKSDWELGELPMRTNADIYRQSFTDIQVTEDLPDPRQSLGFAIVTANAAKARVAGAELETLALVSRSLELGVNFDWLDFEYTHFDPDVPQAQIDSVLSSRTGGRPRFKYGVNGLYRLPVDSSVGEVSARANWNWQASQSYEPPPLSSIPAYGLLNVSLNWEHIYGSPVEASFFMSNALNKNYLVTILAGYSIFGFADARYGEPRLYGLRFNYRFGGEAAK